MDRLASRPTIEESHERDAEAGEKADLEAMLGDFGVGGGKEDESPRQRGEAESEEGMRESHSPNLPVM